MLYAPFIPVGEMLVCGGLKLGKEMFARLGDTYGD